MLEVFISECKAEMFNIQLIYIANKTIEESYLHLLWSVLADCTALKWISDCDDVLIIL